MSMWTAYCSEDPMYARTSPLQFVTEVEPVGSVIDDTDSMLIRRPGKPNHVTIESRKRLFATECDARRWIITTIRSRAASLWRFADELESKMPAAVAGIAGDEAKGESR